MPKEYIERGALIDELEDLHEDAELSYLGVYDCVKTIPTADVVVVVRCEDCVKDGRFDCPICYIENKTLQFINHDANFYCSYGERKENNK